MRIFRKFAKKSFELGAFPSSGGSGIGWWRYTLMSAGLLWPVVMRKSERLSVLCVQSSLRHSCFEKCVSISHFANLLSFAFLKNHLKRADKLFCELEDFHANVGDSINVYWFDTSKFALKAHYATSGISSLFSWFWHAHFSTQRPLQLRSRYFTTLS